MAYKKPQIVAKSDAKQTFVAGCPQKSTLGWGCGALVAKCELRASK